MTEQSVEDFFKFVNNRHQIFLNRFDPSFSNNEFIPDPYIANFHYTNVYRELDRGTVFYIKYIGDENAAPLGPNAFLKLFSTLMYRLFNRIETYSEITKQLIAFDTGWNKDFVIGVLKAMEERGEPVFTNAFMVTGSVYKNMDKPTQMVTALDEIWKDYDGWYLQLTQADTLEDAWKTIKAMPGFGPFLAYEVVCDLMYAKIIPFTENDWVNVGPGAKKGIREIWPNLEESEFEKNISFLCYEQDTYLIPLGFNYLNGRRLTLRNIEHSLCEYSKYRRAVRGERMKRKWHGPTVDDGWYQKALYELYGIGKPIISRTPIVAGELPS